MTKNVYWSARKVHLLLSDFNLLAPELFFSILAHPVYTMWIIQEPNMLNYETNCILKRKNGEYIPCLKYSVPIFVEQIYKMQRLDVSGAVRPLY